MSSLVSNTGVGMMLKAMGMDPAVVQAKLTELEAMGTVLAAELKAKVGLMEARLGGIEKSLEMRVSNLETTLLEHKEILLRLESLLAANQAAFSRVESMNAGITPAGESSDPLTVNPQTQGANHG